MRINNNLQNINFNGIIVPNMSFEKTKDLAKYLEKACVNVVGHKTYYVNNTFDSKLKTAQYVRSQYRFKKDECGMIILPWSRETLVLAKQNFEQYLISLIKDYDDKARINLLL